MCPFLSFFCPEGFPEGLAACLPEGFPEGLPEAFRKAFQKACGRLSGRPSRSPPEGIPEGHSDLLVYHTICSSKFPKNVSEPFRELLDHFRNILEHLITLVTHFRISILSRENNWENSMFGRCQVGFFHCIIRTRLIRKLYFASACCFQIGPCHA